MGLLVCATIRACVSGLLFTKLAPNWVYENSLSVRPACFFRWILHEMQRWVTKHSIDFGGKREGGRKRKREWGWSSERDGRICRISVTVSVCVCIPHGGLINKWCLKWEQLSTDHPNFIKSACLQSCVWAFTRVHVCRSWVILASSFPGTCLYWVCVLAGFLHFTAGILSMLMMKGEALPWETEQTHRHINIYLARDAREH